MNPIIKTRGIVLTRQNIRECDRIFFIYTEDFGKIEAVAKGALKIKSKLAAHLEPFAVVNLVLAKGKKAYQITGASVERHFKSVGQDFLKIVLAGYASEIILKLSGFAERDESAFRLLESFLGILDRKGDKNELLCAAEWFTVRALALFGYNPELENCVHCGAKVKSDAVFFSFSRGGTACGDCAARASDAAKVSASAIKILRLMAGGQRGGSKIIIKKKSLAEAKKMIDGFIDWRLEHPLKSRAIVSRFWA